MIESIPDLVRQVEDDPSIRVLIVQGAAGNFCAGGDIGILTDDANMDRYDEGNRLAIAAIAKLSKPTIAAIDGACVGGGLAVAAACDFRVATNRSKLGITPARLGVVIAPYAVESIVRIVGLPAANTLFLCGDIIDAAAAHAVQLVHDVVDPSELEQTALTLGQKLASRSLLSQSAIKDMARAETTHDALSVHALWKRRASDSGETVEGATAFVERRPAIFPWTGAAYAVTGHGVAHYAPTSNGLHGRQGDGTASEDGSDSKVEFGSRAWLDAVRVAIEEEVVKPAGAALTFSTSETLLDPPHHLRRPNALVGWHCFVRDGQLTFFDEPSTKTDYQIIVDWSAALPVARLDYDTHADVAASLFAQLAAEGKVERRGERSAEAEAFMVRVHNRMARITA
jgi:enoyl-CoA hydratase/carnithine racemase